MSSRRKLLLCLGAILSLPAAGYSVLGFVFYAWRESLTQRASENAILAFGALTLAVLFILLFVVCVVALIKGANRGFREKQHAAAVTTKNNA